MVITFLECQVLKILNIYILLSNEFHKNNWNHLIISIKLHFDIFIWFKFVFPWRTTDLGFMFLQNYFQFLTLWNEEEERKKESYLRAKCFSIYWPRKSCSCIRFVSSPASLSASKRSDWSLTNTFPAFTNCGALLEQTRFTLLDKSGFWSLL